MNSLRLIYLLFVLFSLTLSSADAQAFLSSRLLEIPTNCKEGGESNLFIDDRGTAWLSWVEFADDSTDVLRCTWLDGDTWAPVQEVARGTNWFVNWADFPSLAVFPGSDGKRVAAHWLQKSASGTFDYDIHVRISSDRGQTWKPSFILNQDGIAAEHGFVSLVPSEIGYLRAIWLDGRNTKSGEHEGAGHEGHHGAMSLRSARIQADGTISEDTELDSKVCDCCQTDAALSASGTVAVYRNRSDEEIRDIYVVRHENGKWGTPYPLHRDNWMIAGCPVNGPAICAAENRMAVAWFTAAKGISKVQLSLSTDAGKTFRKPIRIDDGNPIGRVDVEWVNEDMVAVTWLEQREDYAVVRLQYVKQNGKKMENLDLMHTSTARSSGFPILAKDKTGLLLSATQVSEQGKTKVRTFRIIPSGN